MFAASTPRLRQVSSLEKMLVCNPTRSIYISRLFSLRAPHYLSIAPLHRHGRPSPFHRPHAPLSFRHSSTTTTAATSSSHNRNHNYNHNNNKNKNSSNTT